MPDRTKNEMLRHFLAALAYRTQKALRDAPEGFASFDAGHGVRTPHELICHMRSVLGYARTFFIGGTYDRPVPDVFEDDINAFHEMLDDLNGRFERGEEFSGITEERFLQGPFSDAMTHAGQLAMLRRLHETPVPSENFIYADVSAENVSAEQSHPVMPDADWTPEHK
ncbi:MAG: hypothetical protein ABL952_15245 [Pyrinomonadaceae bacterium]